MQSQRSFIIAAGIALMAMTDLTPAAPAGGGGGRPVVGVPGGAGGRHYVAPPPRGGGVHVHPGAGHYWHGARYPGRYGGYWGGWGVGLGLGVGLAYGNSYPYPYPYGYGYPYAWSAPVVVVEQPATTFIQLQPATPVLAQTAPAAPLWYYCSEPAGYFPYVQTCNQGWLAVVPQLPSNPSPPRLAP